MDLDTTPARRPRRRSTTCTLLLALAWSVLAGPLHAQPSPPVGDHAAANERIGLAHSELFVLDVPASPDASLTINLTIAGMPLTLDLAAHAVRGPGHQVLEHRADGRMIALDPGPARTVRGSAREVPEVVAAGGLTTHGLLAMITVPDIEGRYWLQPAPEVGPGTHVLYHDLDRLEPAGECGVGDVPAPAGDPSAAQGGVAGDDCLWTVELAIDADFPYFQDFGGDTLAVIAQIEAIINAMNVQYERDVQITHEIVTLIIRTSVESDPYSSNTNPSIVLNELRSHWNIQMGNVPRDVVQLFTGRNLAGSVIGIAYLGGICNDVGYSVVQNFSGFSCQTDLSAHELGHNWNAGHCSCPSNTMNSSLTCSNVFNPNSTVPAIVSYRNAIANCLDSSCGLTNDDCVSATPIGAGAYGFDTTTAFTGGPGESACGGGLTEVSKDIWYRFVAPCNGPVTISICDATFATRVLVYEGFCPIVANEAIACGDEPCEDEVITVDVEDGWPYLIRIGGRAGQSGQGTLVIDDGACLPPAANDDCGSGATIEEGSFAFSTIGATTDGPPEAACGEAEIANDVWYRFLATCDDVATVRVCDVDFDARVAVYEGTCPGEPGLALDCAADGCGDGVTLTFPISAGSIYRIRVGSSDGATGAGSLELLCGEPPPTCLGDTDGNGAVDVDDLVAVILDWGTDGGANGTDIDGSGLVDVDDLVAVILAWGQCP